ncbi:dihydroxyacetone kinase subunit DhaK [Entomospira nematocerorum]|uniref:phosphoenolpyruvate--glycerone phosphotransferase n=1 Tax=Entomospira nematocerorum TaxID=2719987 RepID=A0A968GDW9_9SPIO|nr:dihydroxyacetone kinase subunit DhaK [Entomospira nematocera]NIZ47277.1 dihydroxyacetone kinase subunit DhaK [Entomospira nematocera]WDI34181.1 dihydroxyacetone kinase subunit DhaK [Entomospira nematocera]
MKKIINHIENIVSEMCHGIILAHPELELQSKHKIILRKQKKNNKVSLISGGGSGHEPAHAGFVGEGMLDAAVCGDVFASPSQIQVYHAIREVATEHGVLLIIKNYSGDMMNFKNAAHLAQEDGIHVEYVQVNDDIAVQDSLYTVGRRGVAGTIFVHKIAGAAAELGLSLQEVKRVAEKTIQHTKSIGLALSSCTVPAKGTPTFHLEEEEIEYGVGIHGEPGIQKKSIASSDAMAQSMVQSLTQELSLSKDDRVAIIINGFGATPLMELYILNHSVAELLHKQGITVRKTLVGNYMTSIDMAGASISILKLDDELESLLHAPCATPALQVHNIHQAPSYQPLESFHENRNKHISYTIETPQEFSHIKETFTLNNMIYLVDAMAEIIISNEQPFCDLDAHAGDGDFGMSISKGFKELKHQWKEIIQNTVDIGDFLGTCSLIIMEHCGGASGPIWGSAFRAAGRYTQGKSHLTISEFAKMLQAATVAIQHTGERSFGRGAAIGDKTLIDALIPTVEAWEIAAEQNLSWSEAFHNGANAAVAGAESTKNIVAHMGRAGTVGERSIGYPDAGAYALGVIFSAITQKMLF